MKKMDNGKTIPMEGNGEIPQQPKPERKLSPLEIVEQALREEEEKSMGVWTKLYEGLSEADQENLLKSANNIIDKFATQYPEDLPDIVILPEISARPLYYLLNPAMKALAERRQVKAPSFVYFQTHKGRELSLIDKDGNEMQMTSAKELRKMLNNDNGLDSFLQSYLQDEIEARETGPEKARKMRGLMKSRAEEIRAYAEAAGISDPQMVIFDDYVTQKHSSIDEVRLAFGTDIPAYCLLQDRGVMFPDNLHIFTGMEDPYGTREIANSQGFEYRSKNDGNRHAIGVEKDKNSIYVKNSPARNIESMQNLRNGLQAVGQQVAQRLAA